jgi:ankyrin repeat protein
VFKLEQHEYQSEGILWQFISFPDNQDVLDLIDKRHVGILALLDEQCIVPNSNDTKFTRYLYSKCEAHTRFSASSSQRVNHKFSVEHYAGPVEYTTSGWLEKNRDQLPDASVELLRESTFALIHQIRPFIRAEALASKSKVGGGGNKGGRFGGARHHGNGAPAAGKPMGGSISAKSVGAQFTEQLKLLRKRIDTTTPHYIRCLKPNDELIPYCFQPRNVVEQLRCGGVLEAVRVSRAGYPTRYPHEVFLRRYFVLGEQGLVLPTTSTSSSQGLAKPGGGHGTNGGRQNHHHHHHQPTTQESLKHLIDVISYDIWQADLLLIKSLREAQKAALATPRHASSANGTGGSFSSPSGKQRTLAAIHKTHSPMKQPTPSRKSQITSQLKELQQAYDGGDFPESPEDYNELNFAARCAIAGLQLGRTKVFLRREAFDRIEAMRSQALKGAASCLQALARGRQTRKFFCKMKAACVTVQSLGRMICAKHVFQRLQFQQNAIFVLQKAWRHHQFYEIQKCLSFTTRTRQVQATLELQRAMRGKSARNLFGTLREAKRQEEEDAEAELEAEQAADRAGAVAATQQAKAEKLLKAKVHQEQQQQQHAAAAAKAATSQTRSRGLEQMLNATAQQQAVRGAETGASNYEDQSHIAMSLAGGGGASTLGASRPYNPELVNRKNELYQCMEQEDWALVEKMLDRYPELCAEEEPSTGELALHVISRHAEAWSLLIDHVILQNPQALLHRDRMGALPLHHAAAHNSVAALEIVYMAYKEAVNQVDYRGRLPLHVASEFDALESVKFLLSTSPESAYTMVHRPPSNSGGGLPLHVACRNFSSIGVITALLAENFASGKRTDENGDLPLHLILRGGGDEVDQVSVKTLLTCFSAAVSRTDMNGDLPLAIALKHECSPLVLNYLLVQYPNAATALDGEGHSPLYLALANDAEDRVVLSLLNHAPYLAVAKDDPTGLLPLQVAMEHGHSHNIVYHLLKRDLPIDLKDKVQPQMLQHHYSWNYLLSESNDEYFQVVTKLLGQCTQPQVLALAHVEGPTGKMALASATPVCKHELRVMLRLFNSLEVVNQRPAYSNPSSDTQIFYALRYDPPVHHQGLSDTSNFTVIHQDGDGNAGSNHGGHQDFVEDMDHHDDNASLESGMSRHHQPERTTVPLLTQKSQAAQAAANVTVEERLYQIRKEKGQQVIAKLTSRSEIVERELRVRKHYKLSRNYVPSILSVHHTVQHAAYSEAMAEPGYCITMEGADTTCENLLLDCRQQQKPFPLKALKRIGIALLHMHEHGLVHGDFGTHNIGKFKQRWKLLGVGGSVPLQEYTDPTRGFYHPPEAIKSDKQNHGIVGARSSSNSRSSSHPYVISIQAHSSYDIWAYGVVLYEAVAGFPLSPYARRGQPQDNTNNTNNGGESSGADLSKIQKWDESALEKALKYVHARDHSGQSNVGSGAAHDAYDLLARLLHPSPRTRMHSMREALEHPFFQDSSSDAASVVSRRSRSSSRNSNRYAAHTRSSQGHRASTGNTNLSSNSSSSRHARHEPPQHAQRQASYSHPHRSSGGSVASASSSSRPRATRGVSSPSKLSSPRNREGERERDRSQSRDRYNHTNNGGGGSSQHSRDRSQSRDRYGDTGAGAGVAPNPYDDALRNQSREREREFDHRDRDRERERYAHSKSQGHSRSDSFDSPHASQSHAQPQAQYQRSNSLQQHSRNHSNSENMIGGTGRGRALDRHPQDYPYDRSNKAVPPPPPVAGSRVGGGGYADHYNEGVNANAPAAVNTAAPLTTTATSSKKSKGFGGAIRSSILSGKKKNKQPHKEQLLGSSSSSSKR